MPLTVEIAVARSGAFAVLPPELVDTIFSYLAAFELSMMSQTCRRLRSHANSDLHWQKLVGLNLPTVPASKPWYCASFQDLYTAHEPLWFLPRYKIWFSGLDMSGKLIFVRYDERTGYIEGYQLVAVGDREPEEEWPNNDGVTIQPFKPHVSLHLDKPVLKLRPQDNRASAVARALGTYVVAKPKSPFSRFREGLNMSIDGSQSRGIQHTFLFARPIENFEELVKENLEWPYRHIWPSPVIPARHHVAPIAEGFSAPDDLPRSRQELCEQAFHIRTWMQRTFAPMGLRVTQLQGGNAGVAGNADGADHEETPLRHFSWSGARIGQETTTYSTLEPSLYQPTPDKPWRGIWVGDYNDHGCEFLLIHQPDDEPFDEDSIIQGQGEADDAFERRKNAARIYRGRLEAIKLTGDPNVPRGEHTFIVDDLGDAGFVGISQDPPFTGVRIVKSKGHIANAGFYNGLLID
jgi:hypothetical protein